MSGATYICITDDSCPKPGHGKFIYFCRLCHEEWELKFPLTKEAIRKGLSKSSVDQARKKDLANLRAGLTSEQDSSIILEDGSSDAH